jgi:hypothetical protein
MTRDLDWSYAICGVLWPSKKFEDEDLIRSGAAALNSAIKVEHLRGRVDDLRSLYAATEWPSVASSPPAEFQQLEHLMEVIEFDPNAPDDGRANYPWVVASACCDDRHLL